MINKFILTLFFLVTSLSSAQAAIMVEKLNCSLPARNGHIFISTPAPELKIISRFSIFGIVKNYILETVPESDLGPSEQMLLEPLSEQLKEGWLLLEADGTKVSINDDNTKATIQFHYGAKSRCKLDGLNF